MLFLLLGLVIMWLLYRNFNAAYLEECSLKGIAAADCNLFDKIWSDFKGADFRWILLALVLFMISNVSRALRWHMLLKPLGYAPRLVNSVGAIMVAYLVNLGLPRSGEFVRAGILSKYEGYSADRVMGTIVTDRIIDVVCLLSMIMLGLVLSYETIGLYIEDNLDLKAKFGWILDRWWLVMLLMVIAVLGMYTTWRMRSQLLDNKIGNKISSLAKGLWEGIYAIRKLENPLGFVAHSVLIWTLYYLMTYFCMFAFAPTAHLSPVQGLVVFLMGALGIVFPMPGGMGTYHYMISQGLLMYGLSEADGFSFANIIFFSIQIFCNILFGVLGLLLLPFYNGKRSLTETKVTP